MELPSIGKNCSDHSCSQLDFLPNTCPYCKQIFCEDHWKLDNHQCPNKDDAILKDQRVPICPICEKPVPIAKGENPNIRMEEHIAQGCPEPPATISKPIYTNSCNLKNCKNRSPIPVVCQRCHLNYCLKHRLENDHACKGISKPNGAASRTNGNNNNSNQRPYKATATMTPVPVNRIPRAPAAAQSRATATPSRGGNPSSTGKKDKDKCLIS